METVEIEKFGTRDGSGLLRFLAYCKERSDSSGEPRIASISLRVRDLDPLAVLRSIQEPNEPHLYMERSPVSVSGAESVATLNVAGANRLSEASQFVRKWSSRIIATGDLDGWFSGPLFFNAFSFSERNDPAATVFVPKWQICRTDLECVAVANVLIDPKTDLASEAERVLRAHQTFSELALQEKGDVQGDLSVVDVEEEDPELFKERVGRALHAIEKGEMEKIVLSRWMDLRLSSAIRPLELLRKLRERFPECYSFSYSRGNGASWIGATPECLVRLSGSRFETEALAGSAARGQDLASDTALGRALLSSEKDLREHAFVVNSIRAALEELGLTVLVGRHPHLLRLSNVQHLRTPIYGDRSKQVGLLQIAESLHPTPAVGGSPREKALGLIDELEPFLRGLYTGFLGWEKPTGEGQSVVALRTARIEDRSARLFAGAGIVDGSVPEKELRETTIKLDAMSRVIRGA